MSQGIPVFHPLEEREEDSEMEKEEGEEVE